MRGCRGLFARSCEPFDRSGAIMSKRARKRRAGKKKGANHGKKPNC